MVNLRLGSATAHAGNDAHAAEHDCSHPGPERKRDDKGSHTGSSNQRIDCPDETPRPDEQDEADENDGKNQFDEVGHGSSLVKVCLKLNYEGSQCNEQVIYLH